MVTLAPPAMRSPACLIALLALPLLASAADLNGTWKAQFQTQAGLQNCAFTFVQDATKIIGKAASDTGGEKQETELRDIKLDGDTLSFSELLRYQGTDVRVTYVGHVGAGRITFTRQVGASASEELTAMRQDPEARVAAAPRAGRPPSTSTCFPRGCFTANEPGIGPARLANWASLV